MAKPPPNINLRGIRQQVPQGYVLGRTGKGGGRVELISVKKLQSVIVTPGGVAGVAIGDAPKDGTTYGRKDGAWVSLGSGGGGAPRMVPDNAFSSTASWPSGFIIVTSVFMAAGTVISKFGIAPSTSDPAAVISGGIYDGGLPGPANLLASTPPATGLVANELAFVSLSSPYVILADGMYWVGIYAAGSFNVIGGVRLQFFWNNGSSTWPATAPSGSFNTSGSAVFAIAL